MALETLSLPLASATLSGCVVKEPSSGGLPQRLTRTPPVQFGEIGSGWSWGGNIFGLDVNGVLAWVLPNGGLVARSMSRMVVANADGSVPTEWNLAPPSTDRFWLGVDPVRDKLFAGWHDGAQLQLRQYAITRFVDGTGFSGFDWNTSAEISAALPDPVGGISERNGGIFYNPGTDEVLVHRYSWSAAQNIWQVLDPTDFSLKREFTLSAYSGEPRVSVPLPDGSLIGGGHGGYAGRLDEQNNQLETYFTSPNAGAGTLAMTLSAETWDHPKARSVGGFFDSTAGRLFLASAHDFKVREFDWQTGDYVKTLYRPVEGDPGAPDHLTQGTEYAESGPVFSGCWPYIGFFPDYRDTQRYHVLRVDEGRARWQVSFDAETYPSDVNLKGVSVPGDYSGPRTADGVDGRGVKLFYSVDGGARVEIEPNELGYAVNVPSGATLTLDLDYPELNQARPTQPWVGGPNGEGPRLILDNPEATTFVDRPRGNVELELSKETLSVSLISV